MLGYQLTNRDVLAEIPAGAEFVWSCFHDLNSARGAGINGPLPISFTDILSWCLLTGERLRPWELRAIRALDRRAVFGPEPEPDEQPSLVKDLKAMAMRVKRKAAKERSNQRRGGESN